jgi:DNA polymerase-3 subunit delta'
LVSACSGAWWLQHFVVAYTAERAYELLAAAHERGRLAHAFLISGAEGSGKEHLASRVVGLVQGASRGAGTDLFGEPIAEEVPPLDERQGPAVRILRPTKKSRRIGVDGIRELESLLRMVAAGDGTKVAVVAEAERMTDEAANAFLKTLEEPPRRSLLLLLSANPQRILPTVLSRCVRIPLIGGRPLLSEGGAELVAALNREARQGFGTPVAALRLKAVFGACLAGCRAAAEAAAKVAEKEEVAAYKDATDGTWLKNREEFHKAAAEADYLSGRNRLFEVLFAWMADLLRIKGGFPGLEFPESAGELEAVAAAETEADLLRRIGALEQLRRTLDTNAFEPLALEVGFLRAFG